MYYLYLGLAIVAEVIATTALKSSQGFTVPAPSAITIIGYAVSFYFLSLCLEGLPVGVVYAVWSGVGIVLISLLGWWIHHQRIDAAAAVGMGLIIAGVAVIHLFSRMTAQ